MTKENFQMVMLQYLNIPYRWSGDDPMAGFDCSGGVQELLAILGLDPEGDQNAQGLYNHFLTRCTPSQFDTGSLIFYGPKDDAIIHVGMGFDPKTVFEFGSGNSKTLSLEDAVNQNAYGRLRSVHRRRDFVAMLTPADLPWLL